MSIICSFGLFSLLIEKKEIDSASVPQALCVEDPSASTSYLELLPVLLVQVGGPRRHRDPPFPRRGNDHLAEYRDGVATWLAVAVRRGRTHEDEQCHEGGHSGGPEAPGPNATVLEVAQAGVGEEGAQVEGKVEVEEEGVFGVGFFGVVLVELVRPKRSNGGLVAPVPQGNHVDDKVKQPDFQIGVRTTRSPLITTTRGLDQEQVRSHG